MKFTILNVLILFGITQSFITGCLILLSSKRKSLGNRLFALIILSVGLSLVPFFMGNSELVFRSPYLSLLPLDFSLFIFPLVYLFLYKFLKNSEARYKNCTGHFIVPSIFWVYGLFIWVLVSISPENKLGIIEDYFYLKISSIQIFAYLLICLFYTIHIFQLIKELDTIGLKATQKTHVKWFKLIVISLILGFALDFSSVLLGKYFGYWKGSPLDEWLGIPFSILVKLYYGILTYAIAFFGYNKLSQISFSDRRRNDQNFQKYRSRILEAVEEQRLYLDQDLTLSKLAVKTGINSTTISEILNTELKISYSDFINRYRVDEVKRRISINDIENFTLMALAEESGFKSKTTFYRAFQKFTNSSPKDFMKKKDLLNRKDC
ncbi:MAG: helix-turn-helix domain-containing protein [Bacteroidota bacterium]